MVERDLLTIISPVLNEASGIQRFHAQLTAVLQSLSQVEYEILYVDDGSTDSTLEVLDEIARHDPHVLILPLSRNFGHQIALSAGMDFAMGSAIILMDSDLQHPPELIPLMVQQWRSGIDIVNAVRKTTADVPLFKRVSSSLFYGTFNSLSETRLEPGAADYCLLSHKVCQAIRAMPEQHRFLRGLVAWVGFRKALLPYDAPARQFGQSKFTVGRMIALAMNAVFSFSTRPIRLAIRFGLGITFAGLAYLAYVLARYWHFGDLVPGWASLMSVVLILGGLQTVIIGMVGEYVARVYEEVKGRPLYLLRRSVGRNPYRREPSASGGERAVR